jgi:transcriptional regulator with XRE-family HTH domain
VLHENIEKLRRTRGISQSRLAKTLGISWIDYWIMMKSRVALSEEKLNIIGEELGFPPEVFGWDELVNDIVSRLKSQRATTRV